MTADRTLQGFHVGRRALLDSAHAAGRLSRPDEQERAEHVTAQIANEVDRLEQFTAADLGRAVMDPDPKTVLDPLQIGLRIISSRASQSAGHFPVSLPKDDRILDAVLEIRKCNELQIDVARKVLTSTSLLP